MYVKETIDHQLYFVYVGDKFKMWLEYHSNVMVYPLEIVLSSHDHVTYIIIYDSLHKTISLVVP